MLSCCLELLSNPILSKIILILGLYGLYKIIRSIIRGIGYFVPLGKVNIKKYGKYGIISGATSGIGLAMAKAIAARGMNVIILGRTDEKLDNAVDEIKKFLQKKGVQGTIIRTIKCDFCECDYDAIKEEIKGLDIGLLVNNAGLSYKYADYLQNVENKRVDELIEVNVRALTIMTKIVVEGMVLKKRGIIINVGSAAGYLSIGDPLYSVYSGTKGYVDLFSKSMHYEMKKYGVIVQNHVPYFVPSKLSKTRENFLAPNPVKYANASLDAISTGSPTVLPWWTHGLQHYILEALPTFARVKIILGHHLGIRKRAYRKYKLGPNGKPKSN